MSSFRSGARVAVLCLSMVAAWSATAAPFTVRTPTTWQGILPCADCAGIRTDLTLRPDGSYVLHQSYLGKGNDDRVWTELGKWTGAASGKRVRLVGESDTRYFGVIGERTLRMRDRADREIRSTLNYNLVRTKEPAPLGGELRARGFYSYLADAALFLHCDSGRKLAVRGGAHAIDLERAYLASPAAGGKPMLVTFDAALEPRPADEEGFDSIRVEGPPKLWAGATCASKAPKMTRVGAASTTPPAGKWSFTRIGDADPIAGGRGEAGLEFLDGRVAAGTGCNRMMGGVKFDGDRVAFTQLASTMMACEPDASVQERAIAQLLEEARTWRIDGDTLVLADADGRPLAQLVHAVSLDGIWRFTAIDGQRPLDGPKGAPTLAFKGADVSAATGCNRLRGKAKLDGTALSMPALMSTRMACEASLMAQERAIAKALAATSAWRASGTQLELLDGDGSVVAALAREP